MPFELPGLIGPDGQVYLPGSRPASDAGKPASVTRQNTFEGGTDTGAVTAANSGGLSGDPFDNVGLGGAGATVTYLAASAYHGTLGCRCATTGTAVTAQIDYRNSIGGLSSGAVYGRAYLRLPALPG